MLPWDDEPNLTHQEQHDAWQTAFDAAKEVSPETGVIFTTIRGEHSGLIHVMVMPMPMTEEDRVH